MGSTSSVLQWHCKHCRAINTTENAVCIRCGSRRGAYHDKRPPPVPSRQFKISKRNIVFESHLYDDAEGCDPPPVPAHKSTELREPSSSHLYAELDPEEEDSNGEYAVLEYPEPPNAFPAHQPPKQEPIYGVINKVRKPPPIPPPHAHRDRGQPEGVYYSEVIEEDLDHLPPPLPPHKGEMDLANETGKWYCLNCRIWNTSRDSSCVYCAMPFSDDVVATGTGSR